jgi:hypothetical protein
VQAGGECRIDQHFGQFLIGPLAGQLPSPVQICNKLFPHSTRYLKQPLGIFLRLAGCRHALSGTNMGFVAVNH